LGDGGPHHPRPSRGDAERGDAWSPGSVMDLRELHAARPDVEHEVSALTAERIRERCGENAADDGMPAQGLCGRQGIVLLISTPHPASTAARSLGRRWRKAEVAGVCAARSRLSKFDPSKWLP